MSKEGKVLHVLSEAKVPRQGFKNLLRGDSVSNDVGLAMWVSNGPCPPRASPLGKETGHEYMKRFSKFKCLFMPSMEFTVGNGVHRKVLKEEAVAELDHEDKICIGGGNSYVLFKVQLKSRCKESQTFLIVLRSLWEMIDFTSWTHDQRRHNQCKDHLKLWI